MKKATLFAALALASVAAVGVAQQNGPGNGPGNGRGNGPRAEERGGFLAQARTEDGKIDLAKLPEQMRQERKDALKAADKDGDGFLSQEELRAVAPRRDGENAGRPGNGGPGFGGPGFGGPGFGGPGFGGPGFGGPGFGGPGFGGPGFAEAFKDGKLELAKLPEQCPQERKDALKAADKDGDGFLTFEEMREVARPKFGFPEGKRPDFITEDGKFELAKLPEQMPQERKDALKAADKDGDGFLTFEEMREVARPKFEFPEGKRPDFIAEDGKIDVAKLTDAIKAADKNGDGFIDQDEKKAAIDAAREKFGPLFFFAAQRPFGFGDPGFGAPQFGFGGGQPGFDGPKDKPNAPQGRQGDRPQRERRRGDRPNGDRPNGDR